MDSRFWSAKVMVGIGFLMLLMTSLQGWGMVGIIVFWAQGGGRLAARVQAASQSWPHRRASGSCQWACSRRAAPRGEPFHNDLSSTAPLVLDRSDCFLRPGAGHSYQRATIRGSSFFLRIASGFRAGHNNRSGSHRALRAPTRTKQTVRFGEVLIRPAMAGKVGVRQLAGRCVQRRRCRPANGARVDRR